MLLKVMFIVASFVCISLAQLSPFEEYQIQKKDVGNVVFLNMLWSGAGNYHLSGNIVKPIVYPFFSVAATVTGVILLNTGYDSNARNITGVSLMTGAPAIIAIINIWDGIVSTRKYNEQLRQKLGINLSLTSLSISF